MTLDQVRRATRRPDLTPALRRILEFIASGKERGRMVLQVTASGGRASSQLQVLRNAGYVEYYDPPEGGPDRIRITAAGRGALTDQAALRYRRDDDRCLVYLGDNRIGLSVIRQQTDDGMPQIRRCRTRGGSTRGMPPAKRCIDGSQR